MSRLPPVNLCDASHSRPQKDNLRMRDTGVDYSRFNVESLRTMTREKGWTGADMLDTNKEGLRYFLDTGKRPKITCEREGKVIKLSRKPATEDEIFELADRLRAIVPETSIPEIKISGVPKSPRQFQEQTSGKVGRPSAPVPTDTEPLLKCFRNAGRQGKPFYRTGKKGVYVRRDELPDEFKQIGRDRLEGLITTMMEIESLAWKLAASWPFLKIVSGMTVMKAVKVDSLAAFL